MTIDTRFVKGRRELHFADFDQLLEDASRAVEGPSRTLGNWSVAQILDHLARSANASFDGFGDFRVSWFVRYLIVPFIKNNIVTGPMAPGRQMPRSAAVLTPDPDVSPQEALERLRIALGRFATEDPQYPHPALGQLALQEWVALNLRHAELHLSFIVPAESSVPA